MTNKEAHEKASGMALDELFFRFNNINPELLLDLSWGSPEAFWRNRKWKKQSKSN